MDKRRLLNPDCTPRHLRCYDSGPDTGDRYTLVFTSRRAEGMYISSNCVPTHPAFGVWQHGQADRIRGPYPIDVDRWGWPPALGRTNHLGRRVPFSSLPEEVRNLAVREYCELWNIEVPR